MRLFEETFEDCIMLDRRSVPDGLGGYTKSWAEGATFKASIYRNTSMQARIAEKQGVTEVYTVFVPTGVNLEYHDVFRRVADGLTYRVTSNVKDTQAPPRASFHFGQVTAERWELPDD